jgi:hypothetical protein
MYKHLKNASRLRRKAVHFHELSEHRVNQYASTLGYVVVVNGRT